MIPRTYSLLGTVCMISFGLFAQCPAGAADGTWQLPASAAGSAARVVLAAADEPATPMAADSPDGMGHLPGHLHGAASGDDDAATEAHQHHGGSAGSALSGSDDEQAEACEGMDEAGHGDGHGMMMMMGSHGGSAGHSGHGGHGKHQDSGDATLEAISAPPPPSWLHDIELSDDQQDRIFAILHESAAAQRKALRTAERTHRQLGHIGMASDYSEAAARKLSDQHAQAIGELTMLRVRNEKRILEVLTPEQRRDAAHQAARED